MGSFYHIIQNFNMGPFYPIIQIFNIGSIFHYFPKLRYGSMLHNFQKLQYGFILPSYPKLRYGSILHYYTKSRYVSHIIVEMLGMGAFYSVVAKFGIVSEYPCLLCRLVNPCCRRPLGHICFCSTSTKPIPRLCCIMLSGP